MIRGQNVPLVLSQGKSQQGKAAQELNVLKKAAWVQV